MAVTGWIEPRSMRKLAPFALALVRNDNCVRSPDSDGIRPLSMVALVAPPESSELPEIWIVAPLATSDLEGLGTLVNAQVPSAGRRCSTATRAPGSGRVAGPWTSISVKNV